MSHGDLRDTRPELLLVAFIGLAALLDVELILTWLIPNTNYSLSDGWALLAELRTTLTFGHIFHVTNISPLQGNGAQVVPLNVWANPVYWPFFIIKSKTALDISAVIAVGCLAIACFVLARCFDVPVLPSIVAAQIVIILFAPLSRILVTFQHFWVDPGTAVVYGAQLAALGILGRLESGPIRHFILATGGIFALLLYSLACDPLWTLIGGIGLITAFAVVALSPLRIRPILVRFAALGCCLVLLIASGAIEYVYTLTQYTARVWFSSSIHYTWNPLIASVVFIPQSTGGFYQICGLGWLLGVLLARGRVRVLVVAGLASFAMLAAYIAAFYFVPEWWLPLPIYVEHAMYPLFITAAIAGYSSALRSAKLPASGALKNLSAKALSVLRINPHTATPSFTWPVPRSAHCLSPGGRLGSLLVAVSVPAAALIYGNHASLTAPDFYFPLPKEPELMGYLKSNIGLRVGGKFRGSVTHVPDGWTLFALGLNDIPTANQYSQLITPPAMYFDAALLKDDVSGRTVWLDLWTPDTRLYDVLFKTLQAVGVRYIINHSRISEADQRNLPFVIFPSRPPPSDKPEDWYVYELPHPNLGDYSPTEITIAKLGAEIAAAMGDVDFDFAKRMVLSTAIDEALVPAYDMQLSIVRGGLHVSGRSTGTSLVLLPQQFSNCLRAHDTRVRLVRADLLLTGIIFSGEVDTDIVFDYGIFSPACRHLDLADAKRMQLNVDSVKK